MTKPRIFAIIQKEFIHIIRDPRSLVIVFLMPVIMIGLYGYAITFDIKQIRSVFSDQDRTPASRGWSQIWPRSDYFHRCRDVCKIVRKSNRLFWIARWCAVVVIPSDFPAARIEPTETPVQLIVDGANANYGHGRHQLFKVLFYDLFAGRDADRFQPPLQIEPRIWYNPDLQSTHFIVPGLVAIIMMMICALLTSLTIARERETGTLEQILVSPIRPAEIIFGKVAPYILLALMDAG